MKTVLIISEYNPFHKGHQYQINDIRKAFGEDTAIIALMSGNYTQRGDVAVMDKYIRSECSVLGGVNLVLQLPFPYSASSAEFFARAGVEIANAIGIVDILAFGSESGDISKLYEIAQNMLSSKFISALNAYQKSEEAKNLGHPKIYESVYKNLYNDSLPSYFFAPNNILAIEYIKALLLTKSKIIPYTTKRIGADYNAEKIEDTDYQSASAIRKEFLSNPNSALQFLPDSSKNTIISALNSNLFPCDTDRLSSAVLSFLCLNKPDAKCDIHDADGGLYNRLIASSFKATSISTLTKLASTKKYTNARIKRAIWYSYFGVTSSDVRTAPRYTQVLAMDCIGQALLKRIKKTTGFPVITKPSATDALDEVGLRQKKLSDNADFLFQLSKPTPFPADTVLKAKPFVKKDE